LTFVAFRDYLGAMPRSATVHSVDVVVIAPSKGQLSVLLRRSPGGGRARWSLPWDVPRERERLGAAALRVARGALGAPPSWLEQVGAFGDGSRHPGDLPLSIAYVAAVPESVVEDEGGGEWFPAASLPLIAERQRQMVSAALDAVRARADRVPVAFYLLPEAFTLSALQEIYELLLERPLHKASFRRALQAARLVEPTKEWRSEGRGRPAQLFHYAPHKRRGGQRGVRFDLLAG
jgi:8-oxo-dGTP diphosphatase